MSVCEQVRVFIVDDSSVSRLILRRLLTADPSIAVVGEAGDGASALRLIPAANPDIVLMDICMPVLDGLRATAELMRTSPRPVLMVSDIAGRDSHLNFEALEAGAIDVVAKPVLGDTRDADASARLMRKVRLLAAVPVTRRSLDTAEIAGDQALKGRIRRTTAAPPVRGPYTLLCIGASTGGPIALRRLLRSLMPAPPWPVLIVQHTTPGFGEGLALWLARSSGWRVQLACSGVLPEAGIAYVAPDCAHLEMGSDGALALTRAPPRSGHRPSVDVLLESIVAGGFGPATIGMLLTGMGSDGALGLKALRDAGGWTIAQDEASSVVYGMPRVAHEMGAATTVLPLERMAAHLLELPAVRRARDQALASAGLLA